MAAAEIHLRQNCASRPRKGGFAASGLPRSAGPRPVVLFARVGDAALPVTFLTFTLGYLAIIGVPPFAGFWSKDKIIEAAFGDNLVVGLAALVGAGVTAFYMSRLMR